MIFDYFKVLKNAENWQSKKSVPRNEKKRILKTKLPKTLGEVYISFRFENFILVLTEVFRIICGF